MKQPPIISIKEARKTLGIIANELSDDEVINLIKTLDEIAKIFITDFKDSKNKRRYKLM
jgi:hypothetical protein